MYYTPSPLSLCPSVCASPLISSYSWNTDPSIRWLIRVTVPVPVPVPAFEFLAAVRYAKLVDYQKVHQQPLSISIQWQLRGPVQKKPIIISTQLVGSDPMQTKSSCPTWRKLLFGCCLPCSLSAQDLRYLKCTFRVFVYIYICVCVSLVSLSVWKTFKFYTVLMCSNFYDISYNLNDISDSLLGTNNPFQHDNFALPEPHLISNWIPQKFLAQTDAIFRIGDGSVPHVNLQGMVGFLLATDMGRGGMTSSVKVQNAGLGNILVSLLYIQYPHSDQDKD